MKKELKAMEKQLKAQTKWEMVDDTEYMLHFTGDIDRSFKGVTPAQKFGAKFHTIGHAVEARDTMAIINQIRYWRNRLNPNYRVPKRGDAYFLYYDHDNCMWGRGAHSSVRYIGIVYMDKTTVDSIMNALNNGSLKLNRFN